MNEEMKSVEQFLKAHPASRKCKRGFASMSLEKRRRIAIMGSKRAHELGVAHKYNSITGKAAGKIGGRPRKNIVI